MRIVVLGDIHATCFLVAPWHWVSKRALGLINLAIQPRRRFRFRLLHDVLDHVAQIDPDRMFITGDLTNGSLHCEFNKVLAALDSTLRIVPSYLVPGNHDRYTRTAGACRRIEHWFESVLPKRWPGFRKLDDTWRLMQLDSAVPRLLTSRGAVGKQQLRDVLRGFETLSPQQGLVILCHYPFDPPPGKTMAWQHQLFDAPAVREVLKQAPCRVLFVHGHLHHPACWQCDDPQLAHVAVLGAGSCTLSHREHPLGQGIWHIELPDDPAEAIACVHHVPHGSKGKIQRWESHDHALRLPAPSGSNSAPDSAPDSGPGS